jgi:DNA-binding NarL/FixJ family response regulator
VTSGPEQAQLHELPGVPPGGPVPDAEPDDERMPERPVRVVVADDHPMWRDAVARDLIDAGFAVVGTAADGPSAVRRTVASRPDVLVLDLNLPGLRGPQVCAALAAEDLPTRILILSVSGEQEDVLAAVKAGATGYLVKSARREDFIEAVHRTAQGRAVFTPGLADLVLGEFRRLQDQEHKSAPAPTLTDRETEVLRLVATGKSYKDIAAELFISHRTVQNHVQNTLSKMQMHNRVELVRYAIERGLHG